MKARAHITDDWERDRVSIHLADFDEHHVHIYDFGGVALVERSREGSATAPTETPLSLTPDQARALYEALGRHFGGSADAATLRKDYEAERRRVDLFIGQAVAR